ncbi:MAG: hypothetical protein ACXWFB_08210 [Nitrososphaeraceae archaeon]
MEARGLGNSFLGQVQEFYPNYIVIEKGSIDKERFYIPQKLFDRYDGHDIWFKITEEEKRQF